MRIFTLMFIGSALVQPAPPAQEEFSGNTPCDALPRRFIGISSAARCERIDWRLVFSAGEPGRFRLHAVYGIQQQNSPGFENGGTTVALDGTWSRGAAARADVDSVTYVLATGAERRPLAFAKIGRLLHVLDDERRLMIGNGGWSYTLNSLEQHGADGGGPRFIAGARVRSGIAATFDGRTACRELSAVLGLPAAADCSKLKWRLILRQDSKTGSPATYTLEGTPYRSRPRTGTWAVVKDRASNALVYRLDPDDETKAVSLLKADDNILYFLDRTGALLVGDRSFSYTLNRVTRATNPQPAK